MVDVRGQLRMPRGVQDPLDLLEGRIQLPLEGQFVESQVIHSCSSSVRTALRFAMGAVLGSTQLRMPVALQVLQLRGIALSAIQWRPKVNTRIRWKMSHRARTFRVPRKNWPLVA